MSKKGEKDLVAARAAKGMKGGLHVVVDYTRTFKQMVHDASCMTVGFLDKEETFRPRGRGKAQKDLILVHLPLKVTTEQALAELKERGLEPAKIEDLLAYAAEHFYPDNKFKIVALDPVFSRDKESPEFPVLENEFSHRMLSLHAPLLGEWRPDCQFLALRRKKGLRGLLGL